MLANLYLLPQGDCPRCVVARRPLEVVHLQAMISSCKALCVLEQLWPSQIAMMSLTTQICPKPLPCHCKILPARALRRSGLLALFLMIFMSVILNSLLHLKVKSCLIQLLLQPRYVATVARQPLGNCIFLEAAVPDVAHVLTSHSCQGDM